MVDETIREINDVIKKLEKAAKNVDKKHRKQLLGRAAAPVRSELRKRTRVGRAKRHYRYDTKGNKFTYYRGNLRRSMSVLRKLKMSEDLFVGPDYGGKTGVKVYGPGGSKYSDGWYYALAYGSKSAFIAQVRNPSVNAAKKKSIEEVRKRFLKLYPAEARKLGLNG